MEENKTVSMALLGVVAVVSVVGLTILFNTVLTGQYGGYGADKLYGGGEVPTHASTAYTERFVTPEVGAVMQTRQGYINDLKNECLFRFGDEFSIPSLDLSDLKYLPYNAYEQLSWRGGPAYCINEKYVSSGASAGELD